MAPGRLLHQAPSSTYAPTQADSEGVAYLVNVPLVRVTDCSLWPTWTLFHWVTHETRFVNGPAVVRWFVRRPVLFRRLIRTPLSFWRLVQRSALFRWWRWLRLLSGVGRHV
jgi:hypothetical protein